MDSNYLHAIDELSKSYRIAVIGSSNNTQINLRSNLTSMEEINLWVLEFGNLTNTKWNFRKSCPNGKNMLCMKSFVCQHSSFKKVPKHLNKKGLSKNASCEAKIHVKIKVTTNSTRYKDPFIKDGLCAVIRISTCHSHSLNSSQSLRFLQDGSLKNTFYKYFYDGMTACEAKNYHACVVKINDFTSEDDLANSRKNPTPRTISYWYDEWLKFSLSPRSGPGLVVEKLIQKKSAEKYKNVEKITNSEKYEIIEEITVSTLTTNAEKNENVEEILESIYRLLSTKIKTFASSASVNGLQKFRSRLERIRSEGQLESFLYTAGSS